MTGRRGKERGKTGSVKGRSVRRDARRKRSCERRRGRKSERGSVSGNARGNENASGRESVSVKGAANGVTHAAATQVGPLIAAGADHGTGGGAEARTGRGTGSAAGTQTNDLDTHSISDFHFSDSHFLACLHHLTAILWTD